MGTVSGNAIVPMYNRTNAQAAHLVLPNHPCPVIPARSTLPTCLDVEHRRGNVLAFSDNVTESDAGQSCSGFFRSFVPTSLECLLGV